MRCNQIKGYLTVLKSCVTDWRDNTMKWHDTSWSLYSTSLPYSHNTSCHSAPHSYDCHHKNITVCHSIVKYICRWYREIIKNKLTNVWEAHYASVPSLVPFVSKYSDLILCWRLKMNIIISRYLTCKDLCGATCYISTLM